MDGTDVLARVRGASITVDDVVTYLKVTGVFGDAVYKLTEMYAIRQEIQALDVQVTEEKRQAHLTSKRHLMRLSGAAELNSYCHRNGIVWEQWKQVAESDLLRDALKQKVIGFPEVQAYFEKHREQLKKVCIARIVCRKQEEAEQLKKRILSGEGDFSTLARQNSLEHNSRIAGGHLGCVGRGVLPPEIDAALFLAETGAICGPYAQNGYWAVYQVEEVLHAALNDGSVHHITNKLFAEWLRERVLQAQAGKEEARES